MLSVSVNNGITVVTFAQKGFDHARWLAVTASAAWLLVVLFFRLFGSGLPYPWSWVGL